jgi:phage tail sheath protein FI
MVQVSYPGVYIQEVPSGVRTITGVSTSVTAFVGTAGDGPMFVPTTVLNFTDYTRVFSASTKGEMTDQVRQFFLNGGSQAVIVRAAQGALASHVTLKRASGADVLKLTAKNLGKSGDFLRAQIDYDTPFPERTFNLTVYRESLDGNQTGTAQASETFSNVSIDPTDARFVKNVVESTSQFVALVEVLSPPAAIAAYSASAITTEDPGAGSDDDRKVSLAQKILDEISAAAAAAGTTDARFLVRIGSELRTVTIPVPGSPPVSNADKVDYVQDEINADITGLGAATIRLIGGRVVLVIEASGTTGDVLLEPSPTADLAVRLGLGTAQGGLEVGRLAHARPVSSGYVSEISDSDATNGHLRLYQLLDTARGGLTDGFVLGGGPFGFTVAPGEFFTGVPGTTLGDGTADTAAGVRSLRNLRQNLQTIANKINAVTTNWAAEVQGLRLALIPTFGNASSGAGYAFTPSATANATNVPEHFFEGATATTLAASFAGGNDGTKPGPTEYQLAYEKIASNVDLINLLVLPKNEGDTAAERAALWGPASAFCQARRAFLLLDAPDDVDTVDEVLAEVVQRRFGLVKDHAAFYWPRVRVNPDGTSRFIAPTGSIAGIMARIDNARGVWKAPAGLDADVRGVLGVRVPMSDPENGRINPQAVNAVRVFPNGIISWGARTMDGFDNSGNDDYKYVPVRRLALFLEESLVRGLKFAVFEPNDEPLWAQIRTAVGAFLNTLFRQGAFQGRTPRDAYFVKVDSETTTQNDINLGIVNVVVGFAPLKPAEFVVITIQQKAGQVQV